MKTFFFGWCLITLSAAGLCAQTSPPPPSPKALPQSTPSQWEIRQQRDQEIRQRDNEFGRLKAISEGLTVKRSIRSKEPAVRSVVTLYRKTNEKELKLMSPEKEDFSRFAAFLRQPNTGLLKLVADKGCAENPNVVVANSDCLAYTMPGAGSSYSFRVNDYRIPRLADLTFTDNSFQAMGILLHGIFTEIGNIPLEQVDLQTKGMRFLINFKPESDFEKAMELDSRLIEGIQDNGFLYRRAVKAQDNVTYLLRSVAYRGTVLRAVQGITYNELDFDKRSDVIVAFRIVRRHPDGSVTILWKQLAKKNSPKTKLNKEQEENITKESKFTAAN